MSRHIALGIAGVVWVEPSADATLEQAVTAACSAHLRRLHTRPNTVLVYLETPNVPGTVTITLDGKKLDVDVQPARSVLRNHYHAVLITDEARRMYEESRRRQEEAAEIPEDEMVPDDLELPEGYSDDEE